MNNQEAKLKGKIILKKNNTINKIWHPESTLVFKSSKDKLVIGRLDKNNFISLDDEALELCVKWKFKYDTSLVEEESEVDDSNEKVRDEESDSEEPETDHETIKKSVKNVKEESESEYEHIKKSVKDESEAESDSGSEKESENIKNVKEHEVESSVSSEHIKKPVKIIKEEHKLENTETVQVKKSYKDINQDNKSNNETDINIQIDLVFNDMIASTQLLHKNIKKILDSVQQTATYSQSVLSKELDETKESFENLKKEHNETKSKLEKIRSALGF